VNGSGGEGVEAEGVEARRGPRWLDPTEAAAWSGLITLADRLVALTDGELRRRHGIAGRDYGLLHHLSGAPDGMRVLDLAALIDDSSSCITHRVNRLAAAGLVVKRADPDDQRARRVALTAAGRHLLEDAAPGHVERVRAWVLDPLTPGDVADLARITGKLGAHLRSVVPAGRGGAPVSGAGG